MKTLPQRAITARVKNNEPRIDSKLIADGLGVKHRYLVDQIEKYQDRLRSIGVLRFETSKPNRQGGRPERIAYLNENQCYALVTLSKNTERALDLKFALVAAFSDVREALTAVTDYLPSYREAHDNLGQLVRLNGSSVPESIHHTNLEKMINKALGIPSGSRRQLPPALRSAVSVAEGIASAACEHALKTGQDHKAAYQKAKVDVLRYAETVVPTLPVMECTA